MSQKAAVWPTPDVVENAIQNGDINKLKDWNRTLPAPSCDSETSSMSLIIGALLPCRAKRRKIRLEPRRLH